MALERAMSNSQTIRSLADRMLAISQTEGGDEKLSQIHRYLLRLESLAKPGQAVLIYPSCTTLRQYRMQLNLTQSMLASLADFYAGLVREGYSYAEIAKHIKRLKNSKSCIDRTYISSFEKGTREPWERVTVILAEVFSILLDQRISADELFPELERPARSRKITSKNQRFTRAAIEYTHEQISHIARELERLPIAS